MDIATALEKAKEIMVNAAKARVDVGATVYSSDLHQASVAIAMKAVLAPKDLADGSKADSLPVTVANIAQLIKSLTNHSQWRQVMEDRKLFAKKGKTTANTLIAELEEEMGE